MYEEDVFGRYERNASIYFNCIKWNKDCPTLYNNVCYCCEEAAVFPVTIGCQDVKCSLKVKTYIHIGESCPICLESILTKSNAYLTSCGHAFHRNCLFKVIETKFTQNPLSNVRCPCCRRGIGSVDLSHRYNFDGTALDRLEDFWLSKDLTVPEYCRNSNHFIGMNKECDNCLEYRNS
jgi:hypothetical protein